LNQKKKKLQTYLLRTENFQVFTTVIESFVIFIIETDFQQA